MSLTVLVSATAILLLLVVLLSARIVSQYERGIVFRLGRLRPVYGRSEERR